MKNIVTGIYIIKNTINNKVYIGQSVNVYRRWNDHKRRYKASYSTEPNSLIHKAFRKYGISNFIFEIVEQCLVEELDKREQYWISYYQATDTKYGYNVTDGGNSVMPTVLTKNKVIKIQKALLTTSLTQCEIAEKFHVSQRMISYINSGESWRDDVLQYPLRNFDKKINYCIECGKEIATTSIRCKECNKLFQYNQQQLNNKNIRPPKDDLLKLVTTQSFASVGRIFNVSPTTIRRWCKAYGIPYTKKEIGLTNMNNSSINN